MITIDSVMSKSNVTQPVSSLQESYDILPLKKRQEMLQAQQPNKKEDPTPFPGEKGPLSGRKRLSIADRLKRKVLPGIAQSEDEVEVAMISAEESADEPRKEKE